MAKLTLPVVFIEAETLPEGWENAVVETWNRGAEIKTQYDHPGDPPSRDVTLVLAVADPFAEPRYHRAIPGGIYDLESYVQEVCDGIHDHWIDPGAGKWSYTYHERLRRYPVVDTVPAHPAGIEWISEHLGMATFDQIENIAKVLSASECSRRAQAIVWDVSSDAGSEHSPCLQRIWCRVFGDELVMNAHMRSNDAYKAAFMNMVAFTELQKRIAGRLSELLGRPIRSGQYNHIADSFHVYGSYFGEFEGFLKTLEERTWEQRTWTSAFLEPMFEEAREKIAAKLAAGQRASEETY